MIYFDNAATTLHKPPEVAQAVAAAIGSFGGAGRGVHGAALGAGMAVYEARAALAKLLGAPSAARVAFTANVTESLNMVVAGLLQPGERAVTTAASHNSVLRPLYRKRDKEGCDLAILPVAADGGIDYAAFEQLLKVPTKLVVVTHASNLTGDVYDIARMAVLCHAHGTLLCVDVAQTAGVLPLNMQADGLDIVAFTGHKSLYGPQGTGGLAVAEGIDIPPFKVGGTGMHSYDEQHPVAMPESLEAGTINSHGIAGLAAGVAYIERQGMDTLQAKTERLRQRFVEGCCTIPSVRLYGGGAEGSCGIVALNVGDLDAAQVSGMLSSEYDICTRAGAHCAPLMHRALGTQEQGAVRFSFLHFNTEEEVDAGLAALRAIAEKMVSGAGELA